MSSLFWQLIERSRTGSVDSYDQSQKLTSLLEKRSPDEIEAFRAEFWRRMEESYRWDLWAAAHLALGGCMDDEFDAFRAWLIGQGEEAYTEVRVDPEALIDYLPDSYPNDESDLDGELLLSCADEAYLRKSGQRLPTRQRTNTQVPDGEPWDEDDLPEMLPELWEHCRG